MEIEKFCYTCGAPLEATGYPWSYDGQTGAARIAYVYKCANKRWYMLASHPLTSTDAYVMGA